MIIIVIVCLLAMTTADAAERARCHTAPAVKVGEWWSWRIVDGKKCWYIGERKRAKNLLHWVEEPAAPVASRPPIERAIPAPEPPKPTPPPEPIEVAEIAPAPSPLSEDDLLSETIWPDLPSLLLEHPRTFEVSKLPASESPRRWFNEDTVSALMLALIIILGVASALEWTLRKTRTLLRQGVLDSAFEFVQLFDWNRVLWKRRESILTNVTCSHCSGRLPDSALVLCRIDGKVARLCDRCTDALIIESEPAT
jgi:hypothetical protein